MTDFAWIQCEFYIYFMALLTLHLFRCKTSAILLASCVSSLSLFFSVFPALSVLVFHQRSYNQCYRFNAYRVAATMRANFEQMRRTKTQIKLKRCEKKHRKSNNGRTYFHISRPISTAITIRCDVFMSFFSRLLQVSNI